jgi:hypothetical protein
MTISPATLLSDFYDVLATGGAGATVRASLGGSSSVISADDLAVGALPTAPFVALRGGPIAGIYRRDANQMVVTWWVYDDWGGYKFSRIDALIDLIANAYAENALAYASVRRINVSAPVRDQALGQRPVRSVVFQIGWR